MDSSFEPNNQRPSNGFQAPQPVVQDIFAQPGVGDAPGTIPSQQNPYIAQGSPYQIGTPESMYEFASPSRTRVSRMRLVVIGGVVIIILALGASVWWFVSRNHSEPLVNTNTVPTNTSKPIKHVILPTTKNTNQAPAVDTDGDGLADADELQLKTDTQLIDTDQDGLTDREEVKVYTTDPLDSDTDGDGFLDGEEVKKLYNPKGPGRLFDIRDEIQKVETNTNS